MTRDGFSGVVSCPLAIVFLSRQTGGGWKITASMWNAVK
jgi:hypothetical protein